MRHLRRQLVSASVEETRVGRIRIGLGVARIRIGLGALGIGARDGMDGKMDGTTHHDRSRRAWGGEDFERPFFYVVRCGVGGCKQKGWPNCSGEPF